MSVVASHRRESPVSQYAKTSPPDAGLLLVRQRLHQRLDSGRRRIIWVSGPAGAGKSSLLAAWTLQYADALRWYRVDSDDRDIASFFDWFGKLLDPVQRAGLPHFDTTHILNVPHFARRFFRHAFSTFATDATLVLDNVQEAHDAPAFMQVLQTLVEERPPGLTLVLSSRHPPAEALLAHMATPGNLHLGSAELSCSDQEALALAESQGLPLPTPMLLQRAEGWMAALAVLLRQTQFKGSGITTANTLALADEQLFATFAAQAFASLSDAQQQCLLVNAYSPWIDAQSTQQLCPAVDATQELDALWHAQFFLERQSMDGRIQYNCHALLSAFLKHRVHELWPLAAVHAHCVHHARCCVDKDDIDAAINLYVLVADWQAATQLIEQNAPQLMRAGKTATLLEWIRRIPVTAATELPSLAYWEGIAHLLFQPAHAIICLQTAHSGHIAQGRLFEALLDVCALLDAYFALWENWQEARVWVDELARLYDLFEGKFPSVDLEVRALSSGNSLLFIYLGHPLIQRWLERSETLLRNSPSPQHHVQLSTMLIVYAWWTGEMIKMREIAHIAHHALAASQSNLLAEFRLSILIGSSVYSDGHVVDPPLRGYFERTLQMAHEQGMHLFDFQVWCLKSMEAMVLYDSVTGAAALQKAQELNPGKRGALPLLTMSEVAQRLLERDWHGAAELAQQRLHLSPDFGGWDFGRHLVDLALAHALCIQGKHAEACGHLVATRESARQLPTLYIQRLDMRFGYIHAAAAYAEGDSARGDAELRKSLAMARAQGYRHIHPWWSPPLHAPLLARALEMDIESAWVTQLIKQQRIKPPAVDVHAWPYPIRLHVLGRFSVSVQGEPLPQQGKAQRKVLELLKVLAAQGGRAVPVETLADILWPDSDGADALAALDVTLHRARKLLQEPSALLLHDGRVSFNSDMVWLDLASLGQTGARLSQAVGESPLTATDLSGWIEKLVRSYPAPVLASEADAPWLLTVRTTWRLRVERCARQLADACAAADQPLVRDLYTCLQAADPQHFMQVP